jgi:sugar phosphate isomerase/epimerase
VFNVTPQSVRPLIPAAYRQNMDALEDTFRLARRNSTRVIAYIPPLRQDHAPPYDLQEYARFKLEVRALAEKHGVKLVDLDRLVPGQYWGTKPATVTGGEPELDFMHYQGPGQAMLARAMRPLVEAELK